MTNFTAEELVLYLYKESSPEKTAAIEEALRKDWTLREKINVLQTSVMELSKISTELPRMEAVASVLNYAREKTAQEV